MISLRDVAASGDDDSAFLNRVVSEAAAYRSRRQRRHDPRRSTLYEEEDLSGDKCKGIVEKYVHVMQHIIPSSSGGIEYTTELPVLDLLSVPYPRVWVVPPRTIPSAFFADLCYEEVHSSGSGSRVQRRRNSCNVDCSRQSRFVRVQREVLSQAAVEQKGGRKVLARWPHDRTLPPKLMAVQRSIDIEDKRRARWNEHVRNCQRADSVDGSEGRRAWSESPTPPRRGSILADGAKGVEGAATGEDLFWPARVVRATGTFEGDLFQDSDVGLGLLQQCAELEDVLQLAVRSPMSIYVDVVFAIDEVSEQHQLCLAPRVVFEKSAHSYTRTKDGNICKDIAHLWAEAYRDLNEDERSTWEGHLSSGGDCPALIPQCFPDVVSISNCGFSEGVPRLNDDEHNAATKAALIHDTIVNSPISLYSMMAGPLCQAQEVVFLRPSQDMVVDCFVQALRDIEDRWRRLRQVFLGRLTAYEEQPPTRCEPEPLAIAPSPPRPSVQLPDAKTYASPYIDDTGHLQDEPPSSGQGQYSMAYEDIQRAVRVPRLQGSAARKKEGLHAPLHRPATPTLSEKSPPLRALSAGRRRSSQPLLDAADLSMESAHVGSAYTPRSVGRSSSSPMSITAEFEVSLASIERFPVAASRPPPRRTIVRAKGIDAHFSIPQTVAPSSMAADTCPLELHTSPISIEASDVEELPTVDTTEAAVHTSLSHISTLTPATDVVSLQHSPPPSSLAGSVPVTALVQPGGKQPLGQTRSPSSRLPPRSPVRTTPPAPSLTPQPQQQQQEEEGAVGVRVATAAARGEAPESSHSQERSPTVPPSSAIPQLRRAAMTPSWSGSAHSEENLNEREEEDLQRTFRRTLPPISVHAAGSAPACTAPSPLAPAYLPQFSPSPSTSRPAHSPSSESSCSNSNSCSHSGSSTTQSSSGRGREATETSITGSQSPVEPCPESHQSVGSDSLHREHIYSAPLPKEIEIALKSFPAGQAMQEEGPCQLRERFSPEPQRPLASIVSSVTSATLEVDIPPPSHSHWQSSVHSSYHHANSSHHSVTQRPASSHSASRLSVPEGTWHVPVHDHSGVSGDNGQLVHYPTQMPGGSLTFSSSGHKSNDSENAPRRKVVLVSRLVRRRKVRDTTSGASAGNRSRSASAGRSGSESTRGDGKRYTKKAPAAHDTHESRRAVK